MFATGTIKVALLFPLFTGGSLPPETVAVLVIPGVALLAMVTLRVIAVPVAPVGNGVLLVQVTTCPALLQIQPEPPDPAAT